MDDSFPPGCAKKFHPIERVSSGGYGTVWTAEQVGLDRRAAIKVLHGAMIGDPAEVRRFLQEGRITASIAHPNVVVVYDIDVEEGVPWIAFEYLPGATLSHALERGPLPWPDAAAVAAQVARALEAAHALNVLHRDIKPENVIQASAGHYKVADFGIARWEHESRVQTKSGMILGTPGYLAPEVIQGEQAGPPADLYALAVMLYRLLTGRLPFESANIFDVLTRHVHEVPVPPRDLQPDVPRPLEMVVLRGLAKSPRERIGSAAAMAADLEALVDGERAPQRPRSVSPTRRRRQHGQGPTNGRSRLAMGAVSLSVLLWLLWSATAHRELVGAARTVSPPLPVATPLSARAAMRMAHENLTHLSGAPRGALTSGLVVDHLRPVTALLHAATARERQALWAWTPEGPGLAAVLAAALERGLTPEDAAVAAVLPDSPTEEPDPRPLPRAAAAALALLGSATVERNEHRRDGLIAREVQRLVLAVYAAARSESAVELAETARLLAAVPLERTLDASSLVSAEEWRAWKRLLLGASVWHLQRRWQGELRVAAQSARARIARPSATANRIARPPGRLPPILAAAGPELGKVAGLRDALAFLETAARTREGLRGVSTGTTLGRHLNTVLAGLRHQPGAVSEAVRWLEDSEHQAGDLPGYWLARAKAVDHERQLDAARSALQPQATVRPLLLRGIEVVVAHPPPDNTGEGWDSQRKQQVSAAILLLGELADALEKSSSGFSWLLADDDAGRLQDARDHPTRCALAALALRLRPALAPRLPRIRDELTSQAAQWQSRVQEFVLVKQFASDLRKEWSALHRVLRAEASQLQVVLPGGSSDRQRLEEAVRSLDPR